MNSPITPVLQARQLSVSYGDAIAVWDVSLHINPGELVAVVGPNGAGKSTTINMLTTLLQPDRGQITVAGYDTRRAADAVRRCIGVTFQDLVLDRDLTGRESLDFYGRLYGLDTATRRTRTAELLALVELTSAADRLTGTYSGGMRRRLADRGVALGYPRTAIEQQRRFAKRRVVEGNEGRAERGELVECLCE